ncbi:hypothetical protein E2C01_062454 [Portunus trituberculatus]|uniref:Uncharacterized protein n=1 Tax=Portunus trituberculatus TaxID=210409 RepID=A0A5B7HE36_PORTR|nr:hypothetical protein [Portunus trituberculatus]
MVLKGLKISNVGVITNTKLTCTNIYLLILTAPPLLLLLSQQEQQSPPLQHKTFSQQRRPTRLELTSWGPKNEVIITAIRMQQETRYNQVTSRKFKQKER